MRNCVHAPKPLRPDVSKPVAPAVLAAGLALAISACALATGPKQSRPFVAPPRTPSPVVGPAGQPGSTATPPAAAGSAITDLRVRVRVTDQQGTRIMAVPLDEYVTGCVRAELAPKSLQDGAVGRILQVQAIASRTYAVANLGRHGKEGFDLCDGTHCQLYRAPQGAEHDQDAAARAVADTRGVVITFEGRAIQAVFHSSCGGHTTASEHVWSGGPVAYLRPVPDWFCSRGSAASWEFSTDEYQLRRALNANSRTATGGRLDRVDVAERDAAGRATLVTVAGARKTVVRAEEFRAVLRQAFGARSIQSTWFSVTREANQFRFTGVGYGHGVGLCQAGATLRAEAGLSPSVILAHYYPGTRLEPLETLITSFARRGTAQPAQ